MSYNGRVVRIGVRELNQHTSRVIGRVKRGVVVEVTERGRPVARVVPVTPVEPHGLLERLVAEGRALAPEVSGTPPMPPVIGDPSIDASAAVASGRDEERW